MVDEARQARILIWERALEQARQSLRFESRDLVATADETPISAYGSEMAAYRLGPEQSGRYRVVVIRKPKAWVYEFDGWPLSDERAYVLGKEWIYFRHFLWREPDPWTWHGLPQPTETP